jgi:hypothetical protein
MADKAAAIEDQNLKLKFRSMTFTSPKRQQKLREVTSDGSDRARDGSYKLWKRVNAGYYEDELSTTSRDAQKYDEADFAHVNKNCFRTRDRHTEFVEYLVRDKALSRKAHQ